MAKETKRNPWDIDEDAIENQEKENKASTKGVICPFRNSSIGDTCRACLYINNEIYSKDYPDKHPAREWASAHRAKANMFFNIVFSDNPKVPIVINLKKEAGSKVLDKAKTEWTDILNPYAGKGRELIVKKIQQSDRKYPSYDISPVLDKADWNVDEKVWKKMSCNLDQQNLINILMNGEFNEDNYYDVSSLKEGESKRFRILPPWQNGEDGSENRLFAQYVWRHWGLSEGQIKGTEVISWEGSIEDTNPEEDYNQEGTVPKVDEERTEKEKEVDAEEKSPEKTVPCFGKSNYFSADDEICKECKHFKACARKVAESI